MCDKYNYSLKSSSKQNPLKYTFEFEKITIIPKQLREKIVDKVEILL